MPHVDRLRSFALRLTASAEDADDLVQETVLRAWRHLDALERDGSARSWLFRILRAVSTDELRTRARRRTLVDVVRLERRHEALVASAEPGALEALLSSATAREVADALERLPDEFAHPVELHDLHGLKYREIAEVLDLPIGTVMSRIGRGRRLLAAALAPEDVLGGEETSS